jgi:hypothetical protein
LGKKVYVTVPPGTKPTMRPLSVEVSNAVAPAVSVFVQGALVFASNTTVRIVGVVGATLKISQEPTSEGA